MAREEDQMIQNDPGAQCGRSSLGMGLHTPVPGQSSASTPSRPSPPTRSLFEVQRRGEDTIILQANNLFHYQNAYILVTEAWKTGTRVDATPPRLIKISLKLIEGHDWRPPRGPFV
ncbi:hypothetical protein EVAR_24858_1 [Eumeta japonica]|uniref:Uncharacterized protein n=1 Tax=Eumeta variegata TaxID=151549 RepID=A0A4C1YB85_EUMVA|nr:hypothetical protein EVAR_24858_1 [Eumeta japonica]